MRLYCPIAKVDQDQQMVWGYASTPARDDQGEIITLGALSNALGDYMKFANIREMHQLSAVGKAKEAAVDDRGLYVAARIVDPLAWQKVKEGVYSGFSIGGRVLERNPSDRSTITAIKLDEISLVDRPANPEALFDVWKAADMSEPFNPPVQLWHCGIAEHRHLAKADALKCLEKQAAGIAGGAALHKGGDEPGDGSKPYGDVEYADPGYQSDGMKRYPIDTEKHIRAAWSYIEKPKNAKLYTKEQLDQVRARIIAAWKAKIDKDGPPSAEEQKKSAAAAFVKALEDIGEVAWFLRALDRMQERLEYEAALEGDDSPQPARLAAIIKELSDFLNALAAEETAELIAGDEIDPAETQPVAFAWAAQGGDMQKRSDGDQHLMDIAHAACDKALAMDGMSEAERGHMVQAREALKAAGANGVPPVPPDLTDNAGKPGGADTHSTVDSAGAPAHGAGGAADNPKMSPTDGAAIKASLELLEGAMTKRGQGHQHLMDVAHHCVAKLTDGAVCGKSMKTAARHSRETLDHLHKAHYHLCAAGAKCDAVQGGLPDEHQGTINSAKAAVPEELAKAIAGQADINAKILGQLDALARDVAAIKATPLPPATVKLPPGISAVEKSGQKAEPSNEEIAAALARMSDEERALLMIKASLTRPIAPPGVAVIPQP
jgi:HK97 family phage prohead protease